MKASSNAATAVFGTFRGKKRVAALYEKWAGLQWIIIVLIFIYLFFHMWGGMSYIKFSPISGMASIRAIPRENFGSNTNSEYCSSSDYHSNFNEPWSSNNISCRQLPIEDILEHSSPNTATITTFIAEGRRGQTNEPQSHYFAENSDLVDFEIEHHFSKLGAQAFRGPACVLKSRSGQSLKTFPSDSRIKITIEELLAAADASLDRRQIYSRSNGEEALAFPRNAGINLAINIEFQNYKSNFQLPDDQCEILVTQVGRQFGFISFEPNIQNPQNDVNQKYGVKVIANVVGRSGKADPYAVILAMVIGYVIFQLLTDALAWVAVFKSSTMKSFFLETNLSTSSKKTTENYVKRTELRSLLRTIWPELVRTFSTEAKEASWRFSQENALMAWESFIGLNKDKDNEPTLPNSDAQEDLSENSRDTIPLAFYDIETGNVSSESKEIDIHTSEIDDLSFKSSSKAVRFSGGADEKLDRDHVDLSEYTERKDIEIGDDDNPVGALPEVKFDNTSTDTHDTPEKTPEVIAPVSGEKKTGDESLLTVASRALTDYVKPENGLMRTQASTITIASGDSSRERKKTKARKHKSGGGSMRGSSKTDVTGEETKVEFPRPMEQSPHRRHRMAEKPTNPNDTAHAALEDIVANSSVHTDTVDSRDNQSSQIGSHDEGSSSKIEEDLSSEESSPKQQSMRKREIRIDSTQRSITVDSGIVTRGRHNSETSGIKNADEISGLDELTGIAMKRDVRGPTEFSPGQNGTESASIFQTELARITSDNSIEIPTLNDSAGVCKSEGHLDKPTRPVSSQDVVSQLSIGGSTTVNEDIHGKHLKGDNESPVHNHMSTGELEYQAFQGNEHVATVDTLLVHTSRSPPRKRTVTLVEEPQRHLRSREHLESKFSHVSDSSPSRKSDRAPENDSSPDLVRGFSRHTMSSASKGYGAEDTPDSSLKRVSSRRSNSERRSGSRDHLERKSSRRSNSSHSPKGGDSPGNNRSPGLVRHFSRHTMSSASKGFGSENVLAKSGHKKASPSSQGKSLPRTKSAYVASDSLAYGVSGNTFDPAICGGSVLRKESTLSSDMARETDEDGQSSSSERKKKKKKHNKPDRSKSMNERSPAKHGHESRSGARHSVEPLPVSKSTYNLKFDPAICGGSLRKESSLSMNLSPDMAQKPDEDRKMFSSGRKKKKKKHKKNDRSASVEDRSPERRHESRSRSHHSVERLPATRSSYSLIPQRSSRQSSVMQQRANSYGNYTTHNRDMSTPSLPRTASEYPFPANTFYGRQRDESMYYQNTMAQEAYTEQARQQALRQQVLGQEELEWQRMFQQRQQAQQMEYSQSLSHPSHLIPTVGPMPFSPPQSRPVQPPQAQGYGIQQQVPQQRHERRF